MFNPLGDYDLSMLRKRIDTLAKAQELRDPIRRFAGESQSSIEQDLLMLQRGMGSKEILRRWAIYKKLVKLRKARKAQRLWPAQEAELQALQQAARDAIAEARIARADELMQQVRDFGRYPKASKHVASRERRLAQNLREARKEKLLSPEQESELQVLQQAEMDSRAAARISEAQRPLDPMERFAGESESRITPHRMAKQKEYDAAYYQKNKARIVARHKEYNASPHGKAKRNEYSRKYEATPQRRAKKKEHDAKRRASPHRMAKQKGYSAVYYQKNKAKIKEYQRMYRATPHGKAKRKELHAKRYLTPEGKAKQKEAQRRYRATSQAKAKRKEYDAKYFATPHGKAKREEYLASPHGKTKRKECDTTPHRMATLHGKETTSGRGRATSLPGARRLIR